MVTVKSWLRVARALRYARLQTAGLLDPLWRSDVAVILWFSAFLLTFNLYLLATVLPVVVRSLHTSVGAVESALILFPLLCGLLVPAAQGLVEGFGRRSAISWALIVYGAGQLLAAASVSAAILIAGYALLAGAAGALVLAGAWSLLDEAHGPETRAAGTTLFGAAPMAGGIVGPLVGGLIAQETTWRLAFVAELAVVAILWWQVRRLPRTSSAPSTAIGWTYSLAATLGAAAVLVGVGLADDYGWWSASRPLDLGPVQISPFGVSIAPLMIAAGILVLFWATARGARVRLTAYLRPNFLAAVGIGLSVGAATMGTFYALRLYLSVGPRLDVLAVGLSLAPFGLGAVLATVALLLTKRAAPVRIAIGAGIVISATGVGLILIGLAAWGAGLGTAPGLFVLGAGNGLVLSRLSNLTLPTVGPHQRSEARAISVSVGDLAYALGIAVLGAVFVGVAAHAIFTGIERQLIERQLALAPAVRQQVEARIAEDLRTLTPAEEDAFLQSQPPQVRAAIQRVAGGAFNQGIDVALEAALGGFGLALVLLVFSSRRENGP